MEPIRLPALNYREHDIRRDAAQRDERSETRTTALLLKCNITQRLVRRSLYQLPGGLGLREELDEFAISSGSSLRRYRFSWHKEPQRMSAAEARRGTCQSDNCVVWRSVDRASQQRGQLHPVELSRYPVFVEFDAVDQLLKVSQTS
jgi:hypothetical protein